MFMNLYNTPAGTSYYTAYITSDECVAGLLDNTMNPLDAYFEEIDIIAPSNSRADDLLRFAKVKLAEDYDDGMQVIAIADQSSGYFPYLGDAGRILV